MRNYLILGLLAVLLFSVSAALSLWLNQKPAEVADKGKGKDEGATKGPKEPADPKVVPKSGGPGEVAAAVGDREAQLKYREDQIEVVMRDLQVQREATDATLAKVLNEAKSIGAETAKLENLAKDLKNSQLTVDAAEKENIKNIAAMYESMSPESAAAQLKDYVEQGKLDFAAKVLSQVLPRKSSKILEALPDSVASQVVLRMGKLKPPAPVVPAKGP